MEYPKLEDLNSNSCREKIIKLHYPEFWNYLTTTYPDLQFTEAMYWFYNNLTSKPTCRECGNDVKFVSLKAGYRNYCSNRCQGKSIVIQNKKRQTTIKNYGVPSPLQSKEIQDKIEKTNIERYGVSNPFASKEIQDKIRQTNIERYGAEHPMQSSEFMNIYKKKIKEKYNVEYISQLEEIKVKKKLTCLEKYGETTNLKSAESKEKIKNTLLERYGVDNISKLEKIKEQKKQTCREKYGVEYSSQKSILEKYQDVISIDNLNYTCKCSHKNCTKCNEKLYTIPSYIYLNRLSHGVETCTKLLPVDNSHIRNTTLELFITNILETHNIEYIQNTRDVISPYELDIYIPDKKIAIECNGCYWHSSIYKDSKYHYNKYKKCRDKGIQLLTIWEDWIINTPNKVENLLLAKLGIYNTRIYARECTIQFITSKESSPLLNEYHIQGNSTAGNVKYGLYYNDELVEVMTFSKIRASVTGTKDFGWELVRLVSKGGVQVVGGAERLLKHFIREYKPEKIISYASHDISNGNVYEKLGFKLENETKSSYWYIDKNMNRYHRYNFTKYRLVREGYDATETEEVIMSKRGFIRIYDSGQSKYVLMA